MIELNTIVRRTERDQKAATYRLIAAHGNIAKSTPFMRFWKTTNDVLKSRGVPEMFYGEARDTFEQFTGESFRYGV